MFFRKTNFFRRLGIVSILSLSGCGGDDVEETDSVDVLSDETVKADILENDVLEKVSPVSPTVETKKIEETPDPNGVYLPIYETNGEKLETTQLNKHPVYANGQGYFLWYSGSLWKLSTKVGGGRIVSSGGEELIGSWPDGATARFSPDPEYAKQALFRLAVAYQGSEDNANAIRLFKQFVTLYPEDKTVAEAYLSMGDLAISEVASDSQPNFDQIQLARENYSLVRENTQNITLITDSVSNEGGLIERVAENPEGLVNFYLTFDSNKDDLIDKDEYVAMKIKL